MRTKALQNLSLQPFTGISNKRFSNVRSVSPIAVPIAGYFLKRSHGIDITKKMLLSFLTDVKNMDVPFIVVQQALKSDIPDVEDSLLYYAALHHNLDYCMSRDKPLKKFALSPLPIIHPKEFTEHFLS